MIEIIEAEEKHISDVFEIEKAAFSPSWMEGSLLSQLGDEDAHFVIAVEDGRVLGFCVLHKASDEGELYQIAVDESAKRRGAGDMLMKDALDYARIHGLVSIYLEVRKSNTPAIKLYKKHGFTVAGHRRKYYSYPTEDAVVMSLHVNNASE
jgi:[ribosomal protein S18]-alanine N-acetyltransferase